MNLLLPLLVILFSLNLSANSSKSCFETSDNFYQCIEDHIKVTLPSTQWCNLTPVNQKNNSEGLILLTLLLDDKSGFIHETYFIHPNKKTAKLGQAYGQWDIQRQLVSLNYDIVISSENQVLPDEIFVDFADDGNILVLTNPVESNKFSTIEFIKCDSIAQTN